MKNYLIEFIGTFFLVLSIALTGNPLAIGAMLMVMVYMGGHISGAHYNPAVTLAVFLRKKIELKEALIYVICQMAGAMLAALIYHGLRGDWFAAAPARDINVLKALFVEGMFTFALALVVLTVATSKKTSGNSYYGLAIGFTVMAAAYAGGPISGGAFNPAVGCGPILVGGGSLYNLWIYIVGPFAGAIAAASAYRIINPDEFA